MAVANLSSRPIANSAHRIACRYTMHSIRHASSGCTGSPLCRGSGIPRQPPAGPGGAGRGIPALAGRAASGAALPAGRRRLARQVLPAERRQDRSCRDWDAQRVQRHTTRRSQHQSRQHGGDRLFPAHQAVRSGRSRCLPDHRRLGWHRDVPDSRQRGLGGARRRGCHRHHAEPERCEGADDRPRRASAYPGGTHL